MVGGLRAMTERQLPPNCEEAIILLRELLSRCSYPDLDISDDEGAKTLLARRQVAEASLQRLEIRLGFRKPPVSRKRKKTRRR